MNTIPDKKFLIIFQDSINNDQEPKWLIGIKLGINFMWDRDDDHPLVFNAVLSKSDYDKIESFANLCAYEITSNNNFNYYTVPVKLFKNFLNMLVKMKDDNLIDR